MDWSLFWIIFLFISGLGLLIMGVFGIKGSSGRWMLAVFLILLGLKLLISNLPASDHTNSTFHRSPDTLMFRTFPDHEIDVIFNSKVLVVDPPADKIPYNGIITINTIFGVTQLIIPDTLNVDILVDAVFSSCKLPNGQTVHFGSENFQHGEVYAEGNVLKIRADVVFGTLDIRIAR